MLPRALHLAGYLGWMTQQILRLPGKLPIVHSSKLVRDLFITRDSLRLGHCVAIACNAACVLYSAGLLSSSTMSSRFVLAVSVAQLCRGMISRSDGCACTSDFRYGALISGTYFSTPLQHHSTALVYPSLPLSWPAASHLPSSQPEVTGLAHPVSKSVTK